METMTRIVKGAPVECDGVRIVPIARWLHRRTEWASGAVAFWTIEPLGIQILTDTDRYALDLEGHRSEELAEM